MTDTPNDARVLEAASEYHDAREVVAQASAQRDRADREQRDAAAALANAKNHLARAREVLEETIRPTPADER